MSSDPFHIGPRSHTLRELEHIDHLLCPDDADPPSYAELEFVPDRKGD